MATRLLRYRQVPQVVLPYDLTAAPEELNHATVDIRDDSLPFAKSGRKNSIVARFECIIKGSDLVSRCSATVFADIMV
jgi:hypothetical protein